MSAIGWVSEIMRTFDKANKDQFLYCTVCLRTEDERRLVRPRALMQFIDTLNRGLSMHSAQIRVCYICERYAASAMRFRKAVNLALSIHVLFNDMKRRRQYEENVRVHLNKIKVNPHQHFQLIDAWEQQLRNVRAQSQLLQTEVLIVDSFEVQTGGPVMNDPSDMYVVLEQPPQTETDPESEPECVLPDNPVPDYGLPEIKNNMETVVILDDEDDNSVDLISLNPASDKHTEQTDDNGEISNSNPAKSHIPTHEVWIPHSHKIKVVNPKKDKTGSNSKKTDRPKTPEVPKKSKEVPQTPTTKTASRVPLTPIPQETTPTLVRIGNLLENSNEMSLTTVTPGDMSYLAPSDNNFILHQIVASPNGVLSVPTLSAQIINGNLVYTCDKVTQATVTSQNQTMSLNNLEVTPTLVVGNGNSPTVQLPQMFVQNNAENINIVDDNDDSMKLLEQLLQDKADEVQQNVRKRPPNEPNESGNKKGRPQDEAITSLGPSSHEIVKQPISNGDRIDWEDKIPMDVISFMDATDPGAPMGLISNVRSLPTDEPTASRETQSNEFIDLC